MNCFKFLGTCAAIVLLQTACGNGTELLGKWMQPVPGMPEMEQGILLEKGGKAHSVNMATLQYETWEQHGDQLILSGNSIGNQQTIPFRDTLLIERLDSDSLFVRKGELVLSYGRAK